MSAEDAFLLFLVQKYFSMQYKDSAVDLSAFTKGVYSFHVSTTKGVPIREIVKE